MQSATSTFSQGFIFLREGLTCLMLARKKAPTYHHVMGTQAVLARLAYLAPGR